MCLRCRFRFPSLYPRRSFHSWFEPKPSWSELFAGEIPEIELALKVIGIAIETGRHHSVLVPVPRQDERHRLGVFGDDLFAHLFLFGVLDLEPPLSLEFVYR